MEFDDFFFLQKNIKESILKEEANSKYLEPSSNKLIGGFVRTECPVMHLIFLCTHIYIFSSFVELFVLFV